MLFQGSDFTFQRLPCFLFNCEIQLVKPRVPTNYNNFTKQRKVQDYRSQWAFFIQNINVSFLSVGVCPGGTLSESRGQGSGVRGSGPDCQLVQQEPGRIGQRGNFVLYVKWVRFMKWYKSVHVLSLTCNLHFELCKLFRVYKPCMKSVA